MTAKEGDNAVLACEVEGNPAPLVTWIAPNGTVIQNRTSDTNLTLEIVFRNSSGMYVCNATNMLGTDAKGVYLDVQCKSLLQFFLSNCFSMQFGFSL